jgi:hypothetical protein
MSLIGIDVGSSSIKAAAYSEDGHLLTVENNPILGQHPQPGLWEQDSEEIWQATSLGMCSLMSKDSIRRDPPKAIAISASGRENFLADSDGRPLAPGVMGADIRGAEFDIPPANAELPESGAYPVGICASAWIPSSFILVEEIPSRTRRQGKILSGVARLPYTRLCSRIVQDQHCFQIPGLRLKSNNWSSERVRIPNRPGLLAGCLALASGHRYVLPEVAEEWAYLRDSITWAGTT